MVNNEVPERTMSFRLKRVVGRPKLRWMDRTAEDLRKLRIQSWSPEIWSHGRKFYRKLRLTVGSKAAAADNSHTTFKNHYRSALLILQCCTM
jgi:hypothetical protein